MPLQFYSYKEGCRSTPKLRRNQSGQKYKKNPSIDSFTSLRPNSPGLQSLSNSPVSLVSPQWQMNDLPIPAYTRFPDAQLSFEGIMSPLELVTPNNSQSTAPISTFTDLECNSSSPVYNDVEHFSAFSDSQDTCQKHAKSTDEDADRRSAQHVLSLNLRPCQVAVVKDARHESEIKQIYDWKGNEISYTFDGGFEQFKREYRRDDPFEIDPQGSKQPWYKRKNFRIKWGKALKNTLMAKAGDARKYQVETWCKM